MKKRIILTAYHYSIEPLGIMYLAGIVNRVPGWECKVVLIKNFNFIPLFEVITEWRPDIVGFQIWTGYHVQAFAACDKIRQMKVPVIIGGPHATYFHRECELHANWVVMGEGFRLFEGILEGNISQGTHFDNEWAYGVFPLPDRNVVYKTYPEFGEGPIKSIFTSVGCPFACAYCYNSIKNAMYGGFRRVVRTIDEIITEAGDIYKHWPLKMVYFQDDIFGQGIRWLEEFALRWKREVGIPFHCQIRPEFTRGSTGDKRLDLFAQAGCSGITLAIESANSFLRDYVLFRHMPDELILEGCQKIMSRGLTLRTEQILALPFSSMETDLATLDLNNRIGPTMAWTSILAPYGGTDMGTIVSNFGLYSGNNDDFSETFFDRSILKHVKGGPRDIQSIVSRLGASPKDKALLKMKAVACDRRIYEVVHDNGGIVGTLIYLSTEENERYCDNIIRLQRLFMWLAKVPEAERLGRAFLSLPDSEWNWEKIGSVTENHLSKLTDNNHWHEKWKTELAQEMGLPSSECLPAPIAANPWYFCFFPAGGRLASKSIELGIFDKNKTFIETLKQLSIFSRRHLFAFGLYGIENSPKPIAINNFNTP